MAKNPMRRAIAAQMAALDLTQTRLADRVGVSTTTINRWVNAPENLTLAQFQQINSVLHLPVEAFAAAGGFAR